MVWFFVVVRGWVLWFLEGVVETLRGCERILSETQSEWRVFNTGETWGGVG